MTVEEHSIIGGLGSAVAEVLVENIPTPMKRVGMMARFGMSGSSGELLEEFGLTPSNIAQTTREVIQSKR